MGVFVLHPDVRDDLNEIVDFIAIDSPAAAERVIDEIYNAIGALASFPQMGHRRLDLTSRPIRFHPVRDLVIAYAPDENPIFILAVINGRRNPRVIAAFLRARG